MKFFKHNELRLLWPFYLTAVLSPILFFAPAFFVVYFGSLGLSAFQISILLMISPLFSLIFELPTGAFADVYGRKASVLASFFLATVCLMLLFFFTNFYALVVIFALLGIAQTFESGAYEAWVFDLLRREQKGIFQDSAAKMQVFKSFAFIMSGFLGAFLVKLFGLSVVWVVGSLAYAISFILTLFAKEIRSKKDIHSAHTFQEIKKQAITSLAYCKNHKVLFKIFLAGITIIFAISLNSMISWTPFLQQAGIGVHSFGYLWSAMAGASLIAGVLSHYLLKRGKEKQFIIISIIAHAFVVSLVAIVASPTLAVIILVMESFFDQLKRPAVITYRHRFIPSKMRATICSAENMLLSTAGIIAMPITGLLVDNIGARYTIFLGGLLMIPSAIIYYFIRETNQQSKLK